MFDKKLDESTAVATELPLDSLSSLGAALVNRPYARRGVAQSQSVIRVILADDHSILREGVRALLKAVPDIEVVGEASSADETLSVVARTTPDVVLMDLDMPPGDGLAATREIVAAESHPKVLVLTMYPEEQRLVAALRAGARGYLMKDAAERELVDAIRVVASGELYVRPRVAQVLASTMRRDGPAAEEPATQSQFASLSDREKTVLRLVAEGYNGPEIGRQLGIAAKTVDTYKQRIEEKLGLRHRTDYVRFALRARLLTP